MIKNVIGQAGGKEAKISAKLPWALKDDEMLTWNEDMIRCFISKYFATRQYLIWSYFARKKWMMFKAIRLE